MLPVKHTKKHDFTSKTPQKKPIFPSKPPISVPFVHYRPLGKHIPQGPSVKQDPVARARQKTEFFNSKKGEKTSKPPKKNGKKKRRKSRKITKNEGKRLKNEGKRVKNDIKMI
jgi:hypothetical protein